MLPQKRYLKSDANQHRPESLHPLKLLNYNKVKQNLRRFAIIRLRVVFWYSKSLHANLSSGLTWTSTLKITASSFISVNVQRNMRKWTQMPIRWAKADSPRPCTSLGCLSFCFGGTNECQLSSSIYISRSSFIAIWAVQAPCQHEPLLMAQTRKSGQGAQTLQNKPARHFLQGGRPQSFPRRPC